VPDLVVVTNEEVWPTVNGGRVRIAGLVDALRARFDVALLEPAATKRSLTQTFDPRPRRGTSVLDREAVTAAARGARAVLYTHSYLEPVAPRLPVPVIVDFPNLEVDRQRSFARTGPPSRRASSAVEAVKARRWEPQTARRSALAIAVTEDDADVLRRWGARRVVLVPNASDIASVGPSPADGPVTFLGSAAYAPNAEAIERVLREVWPAVRAAAPAARLCIAGRGTAEQFRSDPAAGVEVLGEIDDPAAVLARASMFLAPVERGAGTQLKVVEAVAAGRVVVATPHSATSAPGCVVADTASAMAAAVVELLKDIGGRHRRERAQRGTVPTWAQAVGPLADAIHEVLR
jgi:glycosyltransferase involved in cell wall biosynthesis